MEYNNLNNKSRVDRYKYLYSSDLKSNYNSVNKSTINKPTSNNTINKTNKQTINKTSINKNIINKQVSNNTTIKKKKKKKKFKKKSLLIIFIVIILLFTFNLNNKKSNNTNNKDNNNSNDNKVNNNNNNDDNDNKLDEKEIKLNKLDNIDKKIDFFKEENIDRYISYKEKNPNLDIETVIVYVNIGLDTNFYENVKDSPNKDTNLVLVNKYNYLGEDYVPKLEMINEKYTSDKKYMTKDAAKAFEELAKDALKEGYNIRAISTYRSYKYQTQLYNKYELQDGKEKADTYSARPGYSEHQTGLAVDVDNTKVTYTSFGTTKEFTWMKKNAYKYGFILRYTKEYETITGYTNEPWHYRYVGKEIATYIQNNPMTYEEYYVRFLDKKNN